MSVTDAPRRRSPIGAMFLGGSVTVIGALPVFMTGALAVQMTDDLTFGLVALGFAVAMYRAASAVTSPFLGRLADRLGATWSMRLASALAIVSSGGLGLLTRGFAGVVAFLVVGGCANALGQPAANRLLVAAVPAHRLGFGFGLKQSAMPVASVLAGISVPVVALTLGWRWAFGIAALLSVVVIVAIGRAPAGARRARAAAADGAAPGRLDRGTILLFAVTLGLATCAYASPTAFYVTSAVAAGVTPSMAGTILAASSATAIATRFLAGWACDAFATGHLRICAAVLLVGSVGSLLLATGRVGLMTAGIFLALGIGWGFNGVFWYSLVRVYRDMPGRATGAVAPGGLIGGTVGPFIFGLIAERSGYAPAWTFIAVIAVVAAAGMLFTSHRLARMAPAAA